MTFVLILCSTVIFAAILAHKFLVKLGIPALLFFLCLGMLFGVDGVFNIRYSDYATTKDFASLALGFIIFYGGFCTKWKTATPVIKESVMLSTFGVLITALLLTLCCHFFLGLNYAESFLIGAVLSSTDAASVFSILREKHLNLKYNTAQLLEIESGSNDPMSYVLTVLAIGILKGQGVGFVSVLFLKQVFLGILTGIIVAQFAIFIFKKTKLITAGNGSLFLTALVFLTYTLPEMYNGNQFLALYFLGIIVGNSAIGNKSVMLNFFDGITRLAQIGIFFILGLLATPAKVFGIVYTGAIIFLLLTFLVRPLMVWFVLLFFRSSKSQIILISWAGLRGVASIVFAIIAMDCGIKLDYDLFHLVFLVSIFSVAMQGTLLPYVAQRTNMVDKTGDIREIFNDFEEECAIKFLSVTIPANHSWIGKRIQDVSFSKSALALTINRCGKEILPNNCTRIMAGDRITFTIPTEY